jgi:tetratricopeptide (TPR) repeat protein
VTAQPQHIVSRYLQQRVLLLSLVLLALLFVVTAALSRAYHAREEALARYWADRGDANLSAHTPANAFEDYRNSLSYVHENADVQLHLAEALLADGRLTEARSYLANLWDQAPGSGQVNLDLAEVSRQMGDPDRAIRYFRNAIAGSWDGDSSAQRRNARLQLYEYLMGNRRTDEAQAVIAGIAGDTPAQNGSVHEENAHLFLRAGDPVKALAEFEAALQTDPQNSQWLAEAAQVAFEDGNYSKAETYFSRAMSESPTDDLRASRELVADVLRNDPFLAGLSEEEQSRRTWRDFQIALARLRKCTRDSTNSSASEHPSPDLDALNKEAEDMQKRVNLSALATDSDLRGEAMEFVSRVEDAASETCGPATSVDQALRLLKKQQEGPRQRTTVKDLR